MRRWRGTPLSPGSPPAGISNPADACTRAAASSNPQLHDGETAGTHLSSKSPKKPRGLTIPTQVLPGWAAGGMAVVRDWDFRSFPAPVLHPAAPPHCVCVCVRRCSALSVPAGTAPSMPGSRGARPGARRGPAAPQAGRASAAGANPPERRPARRLAGRPSKTVRHGFPVGSPLRQTNPAALISPARARWAAGRARGRGPQRGCGGRARRPGLLPRSHSFG